MAMKYLGTRMILVAVEAFVALTSLGCGFGLAGGVIRFPLVFLHGTPFPDYLIPGLAMAIIVGGSALIAAMLLLTEHELGSYMSAFAGLTLLGFEVAEVTSIDHNTGDLFPLVLAFQSIYTMFGLTMLGGSIILWIEEHREHRERRWQSSHGKHATW